MNLLHKCLIIISQHKDGITTKDIAKIDLGTVEVTIKVNLYINAVTKLVQKGAIDKIKLGKGSYLNVPNDRTQKFIEHYEDRISRGYLR